MVSRLPKNDINLRMKMCKYLNYDTKSLSDNFHFDAGHIEHNELVNVDWTTLQNKNLDMDRQRLKAIDVPDTATDTVMIADSVKNKNKKYQ